MAKKSSPVEKRSTTAKEIMSTHLVNATADMTIEEALKSLVNNKVTGLPVVDRKGKMMGVVSEYDLLQQIAQSKPASGDVFQQKILFSSKVDAIAETTPLNDIVTEFITTKYRRLPVIDPRGKLVGIITRRDLMRVFYYRAKLGGTDE